MDPPRSGAITKALEAGLAELPALSIFGERNDPFGFQARIADTFPHHEGHVIPDGNHFPMCDDPELFAATVREWWAREIA